MLREASLGLILAVATAGTACHHLPAGDPHAGHDAAGAAVRGSAPASTEGIPAGAGDAMARLAASPRHAEWVMVATGVTPTDSVRAWVVYPQRRDKAPVVLVIHEIFGLSPWIRAVADQLAADGFIAIAPDLLTSRSIPGSPENPSPDSARAAIRSLDAAIVQQQLAAVGAYGMRLPAAAPRYGVVGFCWGGSTAFLHAASGGGASAAVVYYGASPPKERLAAVTVPILGLYGQNDERVNSTIAPAQSALHALGRTFEPHVFPGAGHGFLRAQDQMSGANLAASKEAWPRTVQWFRRYLGA